MALPAAVIEYLNDNAHREGQVAPQPTTDLFKSGVLDSFALVDFIALLEESCGIKVPDADVNPGNFQTIEQIEHYVDQHK